MFVIHLNQSGNERQVQNRFLFHRCPDFPVSNGSYLYFTKINIPNYQSIQFGFFKGKADIAIQKHTIFDLD